MASNIEQDPQRPVIGVTGNARSLSPSWHCLKLAIFLAGGKAQRVSVEHHADESQFQGLVISGGDDIHPSLYGDEAMPKAHYDEARDKLEQRYIHFALEQELPILGICRGHQLINVTLGGDLHADIRQHRQQTSNRGTILPRKTVNLSEGSRLQSLLNKSRLKVNSLHHQAVNDLGRSLEPVGWDLDGFVQAVTGEKIIGVQWHPEYLFYLPHQLQLFRWLVDSASRNAQQV